MASTDTLQKTPTMHLKTSPRRSPSRRRPSPVPNPHHNRCGTAARCLSDSLLLDASLDQRAFDRPTSRGSSVSSEALRVSARRDSSIAATSTNPRVRSSNPMEMRRSPSLRRPMEFESTESQQAMARLRTVFGPVIQRLVLRRRRLRSWKGTYPPRQHSSDAVVSAITSSSSMLASWPEDFLHMLAQEAVFSFHRPKDVLIYHHESHLSSGIVVLLHGELQESRAPMKAKTQAVASTRPINTQRTRVRRAPDVVCLSSVLCEDRSPSSLIAAAGDDCVDVATIPSRTFWDSFNSYVLLSAMPESAIESFRRTILPQRKDMVLSAYYPTALLLQRSWMWPFLSCSDRVKLARTMEVRVLGFGDILYEEGGICPYIFFVRRGTLTVVFKGDPLTIIEAGTAFGEVSAIFADPRSCSIVAGSVCELYCLHAGELHHRFRKYPELGKTLALKALERRHQWMMDGRLREVFNLVSLLGAVPCLSHTTDAMREEMATTARVVSAPASITLIAPGSPNNTLFVVGRGVLKCTNEDGTTEERHAGDYLGELCLLPHLWTTTVVTESSVDLWVLSREEVLQVLQKHKAEAQAEDISRQGQALTLRAAAPTTPSTATTPKAKAAGAAAAAVGENLPRLAASLAKFNWGTYIDERAKSLEGPGTKRPAPRELRKADKDIESALQPKVQSLISMPSTSSPSAVDCDLPGEVGELQAIIVEQLLLTPTDEQARFLQQVNRSDVKLVTEEADSPITLDPDLNPFTASVLYPEFNAAAHEMESIQVNSVHELEEIVSATDEEDSMGHSERGTPLAVHEFGSMESSQWPPALFASRSRMAELDSLQVSPPPCASRQSLSRSYLVRPMSGLPSTSLRLGLSRPVSSESQLLASQPRLPPTSVDLAHQGAKMATDRSLSVLDRYVKIEDDTYFNNFVKVEASSQEEMWLNSEDASEKGEDSYTNTDALVLLLVHCAGCNYLPQKLLAQCAVGIVVKVVVGRRVLFRTPIATNQKESPRWPVEVATCISFVRRGADLRFLVCDASDDRELLEATWGTKDMHENGGVGQMVMRLSRKDTSDTDADDPLPAHRPRLKVVMMAATASKYGSLQRRLAPTSVPSHSNNDGGAPSSSTDGQPQLHLQVMAVEGLKHRVEGSIVVSLYADGIKTQLLQTHRVLPKTRDPHWPASCAFTTIRSDGGFLSFDLFHRESLIGSVEVAVDSLTFGGIGLQRFPLLLAHTGSDIIGELVVNVLGTVTASEMEGRLESRAAFLCVEGVALTDHGRFDLLPDPLVRVLNPSTALVMQTPLAISTLTPSWDPSEASCFLNCPNLCGSTFFYKLEVRDNDDVGGVLGSASLPISYEGLGPEIRYDVPLVPPGAGRIRLSVQCFPVQTLPSRSHRRQPPPAASPHDALVLVHIARCINLPGSNWAELRDVVATLSIDGTMVLQTPIGERRGELPQWTLHQASAVLRIGRAQLCGSSTATIHVYDGLMEDADLVGKATFPLTDLGSTGRHKYSLVAAVAQPGQTGGMLVEVDSLCGRAEGPVLLAGAEPSTPAEDDAEKSGERRTASSPSPSKVDDGRTSQSVRLSLTCATNILPNMASKRLRVSVHSREGELLSRDVLSMKTPCMVWSADDKEVSAIVDLHDLDDPQRLIIEVLATDLVPEGGAQPTRSHQLQAVDNGWFLVGTAKIPSDLLVPATMGSIKVHTATIAPPARSARDGSLPPTGRPPTPQNNGPSTQASRASSAGQPSISICVASL